MTSSIIYGAAAFLSAAPAWAQAEPAETVAAPAEAGTGESTDEKDILITGSRIPQPNLESVSPVVSVGREEVKARGLVRVEDLLNSLPQASPDFGANVNLRSTGAATVNLRGLGSNRTLVLIDGRRLMPGDPTAVGNVPDLNAIPIGLVERVEVLTGGASAVYGADAIAGVVNFVMLKDFDGLRIDAQTSFYQHTNDNDELRDIISARAAFAPGEYPLPDRHITDGTTHYLNAVLGVNSGDGRGNVTLYGSYLTSDVVNPANRDHTVCILLGGPSFACNASTTNATGRFNVVGPGGVFQILTVDPATRNTFRPLNFNTDVLNAGLHRILQRPNTRYSLGAMGHYEFSDAADVYAQLMMTDDRTVMEFEPTAMFGENLRVQCDNPLLSAQQRTTLCGANPAPGSFNDIFAIRRMVEAGNRRGSLRHTSYRAVAGLRGDFGNSWHYDIYGQYGTTIYQQLFENDFSRSRLTRALDVVRDGSGQAVCRAALLGIDRNCVPFNLFGTITPAALDYVRRDAQIRGNTKETIVSGSITGDLGQYGVQAPWAENGVAIALGAEYRKEELDYEPDEGAATFDLLAGPVGGEQHGSFDVKEIFGEVRIPIIENQSWTDRLALEAGYRYSKYSTGFSTHTYKFGGDWAPVRDIRFRAAFQRAVRAPNIYELFSPSFVGIRGQIDPCAGDFNPATPTPPPTATAAQCALMDVSATQYGNIIPSTGQYNALIGGNPNLDAEKSNSLTFGAVVQPRFIPGLSLSVDWYDIKINGRIGSIGADLIIRRCVETGDPFYCGKVQRDEQGSLWLSTNGFVEDLNGNNGRLNASGLDVEGNYRLDLADVGLARAGSLAFNVVGSWVHRFGSNIPTKDDPNTECVGLFGTICGSPNPKWRHKARLTWSMPWWDSSLSFAWRHISGVRNDNPTAPPTDVSFAAQDYFDLSASITPIKQLTLRAGVNNIFDRDPPIVGTFSTILGAANGNTYPQLYDALGRYVFFAATVKF